MGKGRRFRKRFKSYVKSLILYNHLVKKVVLMTMLV